MARLLYGATSGDYTMTTAGRVIPNAVVQIWDAIEDGNQITDLTDYDGNPCTVVTSGADGLVRFYGPDGENDNLWMDTSQGSRLLVRPTVLTASIGDGSILDEDINAAAAIDRSKIAGTALTADSTTTFNVLDYGATGDGVTDDADAIQAAIDAAYVAGGIVYFPAAKYRIVTGLVLDLQGVAGGPSSNRRRVTFQGAGKGSTVLAAATDSIRILHIQGDNPLTSGSHAYTTIRDLAFVGDSPTARTADGLRLQDLAYLTVGDCSFHNLNSGLVLDGCLSSTFDGLIFNESVKGVTATLGASGPHSNLWTGCEFRALTMMAYDGYTSLSGATFLNCRFEGCGTMGSTQAIIRASTAGTAGEHGITLIGCYIENNRGDYDVLLNETGSQRVSLNVYGTCFNRVSSTNYTTSNIGTTGDVDVNLSGNTFTSYSTYTPDAGRPYLALSSSSRLRDLGNRWEDAVEAPVTSQTVPIAGKVLGSLGASVTGTLPSGWSVAQSGTGLFAITHNLGHTDYIVTAVTCGANNRRVERVTLNSNSFQVKTVNTSETAADEDFGFQLSVLVPRR